MKASRSPNERLAILEQKVSHMDEELDRMSAKVDEMHAILLQARGVCAGQSSQCPAWWASSPASRIG
jgi:hypothetical protein